ncbi:hypothetical protein SUGI_1086970 [Cryptomeria japonica]|nr:hypothetical protein SUGI_1086970 [Cryptomeria japonica]
MGSTALLLELEKKDAMNIEMAMKYLVLAIAFLFQLNSCSSLGQNGGDTLLPGDSLAGNETIVSKDGTFALGFFSPRGTDNWYIGIWYAQISPKVIVWVANRDNPMRHMPGVLRFSSKGRLTLFDRKGPSVWSTDNGLRGWRVVITDPGNLIILGHGHNKSDIVWESFAHPTDTWLPGMKMWKGMRQTSRKSSVDPAVGLFSNGMDMSPGSTQMVLVYNNSVPYWSTGEWTGSYYRNAPEAFAPNRFEMSCVRISPSRIYYNYSVFRFGTTRTGRVVLDWKGGSYVYYLMDDGNWIQGWSSYRGQCSDYNICGAYGLCNANDVCSCIEGFTPKHYTQGLLSSGCARRRPLQCSVTAGTTDGFLESKNRQMPEEDAISYNHEQTLQGCRTACLSNCSCTAFAFVTSGVPVCTLWFGDLFKMYVSSVSQSIFIRLAASELLRLTSKRSGKAPLLFILLPSAMAVLAVSALLLAGFILWKHRRLRNKRVEEDVPIMLKTFTYKELRIATENFKHKEGNIIGVVDARIASGANIEEVRRAAVVGVLCIQEDEDRRPSMGEVVKILEGTMEVPVEQIPRSLEVLFGES